MPSVWDRNANPSVYLARGDNGLIKIGVSTKPESRVCNYDIQRAGGGRVGLIASFPGGPGTEENVHKLFVEDRVQGEWFRPSDRLLAFVAFVRGEKSLADAPVDTRTRLAWWWNVTHDEFGEWVGVLYGWKAPTRREAQYLADQCGIPVSSWEQFDDLADERDIADLRAVCAELESIQARLEQLYPRMQGTIADRVSCLAKSLRQAPRDIERELRRIDGPVAKLTTPVSKAG